MSQRIMQKMIQRNSPRPKGATMGRNQNKGAVSTNKTLGVRVNYDVEDEFEKDMNDFVEKLMSGAATPLNIEEGKKLSQDYEDTVTQYVNQATANEAESKDAKLAAEGRKKIGYNFNFEILASDRRNTSQSMRQSALDRTTEALAERYEPAMFQPNDFELLVKAFVSGRTNQEITQALRGIAMMSTLNMDEATELLTEQVIPHSLSIIKSDDREPNLRASTAISYALIQSFISSGSEGYGLEDKITDFLNIANEAFSSDAASVLCASAISAISLLLMNIATNSHIIEQVLPEVVELLKSDKVEVVNAAGKLIALSYELYDFTAQVEDADFENTSLHGNGGYRFQIPTVENSDLFDLINNMINSSVSEQHITKDGKTERRSIFRKILAFLEVRLQVINPKNALTDEGRELAFDDSIAQIRLSRAKTFPVYTWSQLELYQSLKWLYGNSLATHLANNPLIKDLSDEAGPYEDPEFAPSAEEAYVQDLAKEVLYDPAAVHENDSVKRTQDIQKQRDQKAKMLHQGI